MPPTRRPRPNCPPSTPPPPLLFFSPPPLLTPLQASVLRRALPFLPSRILHVGIRDFGSGVRASGSGTRHPEREADLLEPDRPAVGRLERSSPKPETRNPESRNPKLKARKPKAGTRNPKPETRDPKPETRNPKTRKPET
jgi:hypothetical protein